MDAVNSVLAQKVGQTTKATDAEEAVAPATPMRQMRRALGRAADTALGLPSSVIGIAEDDLEAEALIETGPADWIVLGLRNGAHAGLTGLFLIDPPLRSTILEMLTMGRLLPPSENQRAVTRTDAVMTIPFADELLKELGRVGFGGEDLDPAAYDIGPLDDLRTAGLVMTQGTYRCWRITVQLGGADAQGEMMIALRQDTEEPVQDVLASPDWSARLRGALEDAPAEMDAVLAQLTLPIAKIEDFAVGDVLHLAGTTVGSVTLCAADGDVIAQARLGQVAGKRAVRIEAAQIELDEAPIIASPMMMPNADMPQTDAAAYDGLDTDQMAAPDFMADAVTDGALPIDPAGQPDFASPNLELDAQPPFLAGDPDDA